MNLKIKTNLLDVKIVNPHTGKDIIARFIEPSLYNLYQKFYPELFTVIENTEKPIVKKK